MRRTRKCPPDGQARRAPQPRNAGQHHQQQRTRTLTSTSMLPQVERACDRLVHLAFDAADLARLTGRAKHAEAACYLLDAIRLTWLACEALAENREACA
jgi:hypothetical protein